MRRVWVVAMLAAVLALVVLVLAFAGGARAQAPIHKCMFKRGGVVVAFAGVGLKGSWGRAFCAGFHSTFGGRRFYGSFGRDRCEFYNRRHATLMVVLTRNATLGFETCAQIAPAARRAGFKGLP